MSPLHFLAALAVVAIWGFNFIVVKVSLHEMPPLLLCTLRFALAAVPGVFFIRRPCVPWRLIVAYGMLMFALTFAFLFAGMAAGASAGLAALMLQLQVFITIGLTVLWLRERPTALQWIGALLAFIGVGVIVTHRGDDLTLIGLICMMIAAAAFASGNLVSKRIGPTHALALVIWGNLVAVLPLAVAALVLEGPVRIAYSLTHYLNLTSIGAILYIVYMSTYVGYALWNWLLNRYPVATIAPLALLVPVIGMSSSAFMLHESMQPWKWAALILVLAGLCANVFAARITSWMKQLYPMVRGRRGY